MAASYTLKQTELLLMMYDRGDTINQMCVALNKTRKSVIAKLSKEGVYERTGYRDKQGNLPESKIEIRDEIKRYLSCESLDGLEIAPKLVLKKLRDYIRDQDEVLEETLAELAEATDNLRVLKQITTAKIKRSEPDISDYEILFSEDDDD